MLKGKFFYGLTISNFLYIIVLLILAGIAINLTIGNNGIFTRAINATEKWEEASKNEQKEMDEVGSFIDKYLNESGGNQGETGGQISEIAIAKENGNFFENNTQIKDDLNNIVVIPKNFKIAQDSATKVEDGVVVEDKKGNQFVWIPAKTGEGAIVHTTLGDETSIYARTAFYEEDLETICVETMPDNEENSVNSNGGYYIGRYEAGDKETTESKTMRTDSSNATNTVTIKKGQAPYNYLEYDDAKTLAEKMSTAEGYETTTKLISSFAWDTAINFIKMTNEDYDSYSKEGNYKNILFEYTDITGTKKIKANGESVIIPTGESKSVSNIYDMGGNCWEYTTEISNMSGSNMSIRGGDNNSEFYEEGAGYRFFSAITVSFRVTMFL